LNIQSNSDAQSLESSISSDYAAMESSIAVLQNPQIMGADIAELAEKLDADSGLRWQYSVGLSPVAFLETPQKCALF